jgi:AcrR family transcriptional regulator
MAATATEDEDELAAPVSPPAVGATAPTSPTKERLLTAAARLFSRRGFHDVSIYDLGGEIGMTGAAIYRHFDSKIAVLEALCDRVLTRTVEHGRQVVESGQSDRDVLDGLIGGQLDMVLDDRDVLVTYLREMSRLPQQSLRRMRRAQRLHLEEWFHVVSGLRSDLGELQVRALVHAAIGVLHSAAQYDVGLPREEAAAILSDAVYRVLGVDSAGHGGNG